MGLFDIIRKLLGTSGPSETAPRSVREQAARQAAASRLDAARKVAAPARGGPQRGIDELARRLGMTPDQLRAVPTGYRQFEIPKASGGRRQLSAPEPQLKQLQRRILRTILGGLPVHPAAHGFERRRSIVSHALPHAGKAVIVKMDLQDFFPTTSRDRVHDYLTAIGYDTAAASLLTQLCTWRGSLPQGAPTSPKLSNLVNYRLDARLSGLARKLGAVYTRYADDLTFSFGVDDRNTIHLLIRSVKFILDDEGYRLHQNRKLHIRRSYDRQLVTGLVVNERVSLPRDVRRRLRAIEHRLATGKQATLTPPQIAGWRALAKMVASQRTAS